MIFLSYRMAGSDTARMAKGSWRIQAIRSHGCHVSIGEPAFQNLSSAARGIHGSRQASCFSPKTGSVFLNVSRWPSGVPSWPLNGQVSSVLIVNLYMKVNFKGKSLCLSSTLELKCGHDDREAAKEYGQKIFKNKKFQNREHSAPQRLTAGNPPPNSCSRLS